MGRIDITKGGSVRLGNIGQVREAYAGDFSAPAKALGKVGDAIGEIGGVAAKIALDIKEREDAAAVNDAMASLTIGAGEIRDRLLGDANTRPGEWTQRFKEGYDSLFEDTAKNLTRSQREKLTGASTRLFASSMTSLGHMAMQRTVQNEKTSSLRLSAAMKALAVDNPTDENIALYLGAFTDAEKDAVRQIGDLREAGKDKEADALQEALRIRQRQGVDEIMGENAMREIKAAETIGDEAALKALAERDWLADANKDAQYNIVTGRTGFGKETAHALKHNAESALKRVRSAKFEKAHNDAMETERQMFLKALPKDTDGVIARYGEEAETYAKLAENENLTAAARRSYANAAQSLRQAAAKVKHEVATQAQQDRFEFELSNFEAGMDAGGKEITYDDMQTRARDLLSDGKITPKQFHRLMAVQKKELNEEQKRFRDLVYADFPKLMPNITQRNGRFEFTPSTKVPSADKPTGYEVDVERGFWNDTEETYSYGQFVRAMNAIFNLSKAQGLSAEEMKQRFDEATAKDQTKCVQRNIDEMINAIENAAKDRSLLNSSTSATDAYIKKNSK